jgi:predicted phage tail protein
MDREETMFRRIAVIAALFAVALAPSVTVAADMEGRVQSVDTTERSVTLDNGAKLWLSDSIVVDTVKPGAEVKVMYEEKDGKPMVITIEIR